MDAFYDELIKLVFVIATPILSALVGAVLWKMLQKFGLAVSAEQKAKIEKMMQDAIFATEEWARGKMKEELQKVLPEEKVKKTLEDFLTKVPGVSVAEAQALLNTELAKVRIATLDFLRATTTAAGSR